MKDKDLIAIYRQFLKDTVRKTIDFSQVDQNRGLPPPPVEKPAAEAARRVGLIPHDRCGGIGPLELKAAIGNRESRRSYSARPLTVEELSFLLWATQGVREVLDRGHALRTVPSAGCRHALETYLCILNVEGIDQGIYRYLPLEHQLVFEHAPENLAGKMVRAVFGQNYPAQAAVTFIWAAVPYRMEWRYGIAAHKVIAIDAGHVCKNLYLACEAIGAGACAMAAYDQEALDRLLQVDSVDEFTVYLASVGKKPV